MRTTQRRIISTMNNRALHKYVRGEPSLPGSPFPNSEPPTPIFEILRAMDLRYPTQKTRSPSVASSSRSTHESRFHHGEQNLRRSPAPNTAPPGSAFEIVIIVAQRYLTQRTASESAASSSRSTLDSKFSNRIYTGKQL